MIRSAAALVALYRDAFGGLPRLTWLLCTAAFLNRCGAMVVPFLGLYAKERFGYTPEQAGLVLGIYGAGAVTGSWLGGDLCDRVGPVRVQVWALFATAAWMLGMTQVIAPGWLEASAFGLAVLNEMFRPGSITAVASSCPPDVRRKALSLNRLALNLGWAFGPTIGGYLVAVDFRLMFVVDGGTCALAAAFLVFGVGGYAPKPMRPPPDTRRVRALTDRHFLALMLANLIVLLPFMQYFTTGSRVFEDQGYGKATIGWFLAVNPIFIVLFEMPVVHSMRHRQALPLVALGALIVGVGYLSLLLPFGATGIVLAMAIVAGGELLQMPLLSAYINDRAAPHARGAYNGVYGMTFSCGQILAPLLGGFVYQRLGAPVLWQVCFALAVVATLLFVRTARTATPMPVTPTAGPIAAVPTPAPAPPPPANETTSPPAEP